MISRNKIIIIKKKLYSNQIHWRKTYFLFVCLRLDWEICQLKNDISKIKTCAEIRFVLDSDQIKEESKIRFSDGISVVVVVVDQIALKTCVKRV